MIEQRTLPAARRAARAFALAAWLLAAGSFLAGAPPSAQAQDAGDTATARELFIQASALGRQGQWDSARGLYERSLALKRAPITLYSLGVAQKHTGRWVEAIESFRQFLAEPSSSGTKAYETPARAAIAELEPRLARITVVVDKAVADARVELDGQPLAAASLGVPRPVNPGAHVIEATAAGRKRLRRAITVQEAARETIELTLEVEAPAQSSGALPVASAPTAALPTASTAPIPTASVARLEPPSRALPVAFLAGGGAVLIGGLVTGLVGVVHASEAPARNTAAADRARTEALAGDVLAGIGLAACAVGVVMLVARPGPSTPSATLVLRPGSLGVHGRF
jgi:tetratricopeptide (TPR) repeat protein